MLTIFINQNPSGTKQVLDEDGWINTGDIGYIVPYHSVGRSRNSGGIIVLEGRAKDTIVLSTGISKKGFCEYMVLYVRRQHSLIKLEFFPAISLINYQY